MMPNHTLSPHRRERRVCHRRVPWAKSVSLDRYLSTPVPPLEGRLVFPLLLVCALGIAAVMVALHIWTFRGILRQGVPAWWRRGAALAVCTGFVTGLVSGVVIRWRPEAGVEYVGFPLPGMLLPYEDGRWVDYVGPTVIICPLLNALLVATVFVLPFSTALLVRSPQGRV